MMSVKYHFTIESGKTSKEDIIHTEKSNDNITSSYDNHSESRSNINININTNSSKSQAAPTKPSMNKTTNSPTPTTASKTASSPFTPPSSASRLPYASFFEAQQKAVFDYFGCNGGSDVSLTASESSSDSNGSVRKINKNHGKKKRSTKRSVSKQKQRSYGCFHYQIETEPDRDSNVSLGEDDVVLSPLYSPSTCSRHQFEEKNSKNNNKPDKDGCPQDQETEDRQSKTSKRDGKMIERQSQNLQRQSHNRGRQKQRRNGGSRHRSRNVADRKEQSKSESQTRSKRISKRCDLSIVVVEDRNRECDNISSVSSPSCGSSYSDPSLPSPKSRKETRRERLFKIVNKATFLKKQRPIELGSTTESGSSNSGSSTMPSADYEDDETIWPHRKLPPPTSILRQPKYCRSSRKKKFARRSSSSAKPNSSNSVGVKFAEGTIFPNPDSPPRRRRKKVRRTNRKQRKERATKNRHHHTIILPLDVSSEDLRPENEEANTVAAYCSPTGSDSDAHFYVFR